MLTLRQYQTEALDAVLAYWQGGGEHALIVLATGTGKSLVQATLAKKLIEDFG